MLAVFIAASGATILQIKKGHVAVYVLFVAKSIKTNMTFEYAEIIQIIVFRGATGPARNENIILLSPIALFKRVDGRMCEQRLS